MKKEKIGFISLGCSKNRVDSERIMGLLKENFDFTGDPKDADYIFVNTCGFIDPAKEESINTILEMAEYKKDKCKKLFVLGCLAQRYAEELKESMPEIDRIITIDEYPRLKEIMKEETSLSFTLQNPERLLSTENWLAYLKIAEGCYNKCAYCAIPLIRGSFISEDEDFLVDEATKLVNQGVKELVVVAQDPTNYGMDLYKEKRLGHLIKRLDKITGIEWIRILYLYPGVVNEELLYDLKECKHFIPYFDMPLQYGNDHMLKAMYRIGSVSSFKKIKKKIGELFPDAIFRTTLMVGFPGETEKDFLELLDFIKENRFDRMGAFSYSKEENTPAYSYPDQVHYKTKERRLRTLMETQKEISQERGERLVGKVLRVIIEGTDDTGFYTGRSYASAPDQVDGIVTISSYNKHDLGDMIYVRILSSEEYDLFGEETGSSDTIY